MTTTIQAPIRNRIASVTLAAMLTLATLSGINALAIDGSTAPLLAQTASTLA